MQTYYVSLKLPKEAGPEEIKVGWRVLGDVLKDLRGNEQAMRGFLHAANKDGFPVAAGFVKKEQLEELCVRAFWWQFERTFKGMVKKKNGGGV